MPLSRKKFGIILLPFSLIYGLIVGIRNLLFNLQILKQSRFDLPVISVGNITAGGTGKTPHVEYLVKLLCRQFRIAVLSRGYKRKTRNFLQADASSGISDIGDEPKQIKQKFPDVILAVCRKRVEGIKKLLSLYPDLRAVILDDGFQHRFVKPGLSILLIDYNRPLKSDHLLPYGNLRECESGIRRAHIVIVTKTPQSIKPIEKRIIIKDLKLFPYQFLYFTSFAYLEPVAVFKKASKQKISYDYIKTNHAEVILVTGIANPLPLLDFLKKYTERTEHIRFPDHHDFSMNDIRKISQSFDRLNSKHKIIITTEKNAVRLKEMKEIDKRLKQFFYYIPVEVKFNDNDARQFNRDILDYVGKNKEVNRLYK
ncbi:MAG: tetraacyldisaccharide 4'-kinase [Bacteroidales bacterium]|nr:tetraacyldisaccharide 4'-kinase [Bacteroidales bacterium]